MYAVIVRYDRMIKLQHARWYREYQGIPFQPSPFGIDWFLHSTLTCALRKVRSQTGIS